jgi:ubiquinone/menaquinone biosynthesis C-methylase UbiE
MHWNRIAEQSDHGGSLGTYYHQRLADVYKHVAPPGERILEIGCAQGDLLAALQPSFGVGIDFSQGMLIKARIKHPQIHFILCDAQDLCLGEEIFDLIILSDLLNDAWDVQTILDSVKSVTHPGTRLIINIYSRLWELPLSIVKKLHLARPELQQNWLTVADIRSFMRYSGFEVVKTWQEILLPLKIPLITPLCNQFLARIAPLNQLCLANFILARPYPASKRQSEKPSVTIVVPARNEMGNIERIFTELPDLPGDTEIIFVEGNSNDETYAAIAQCILDHPNIKARLFKQSGSGKGDAVRQGFEQAHGDILMILDADLTVPPYYLDRFYDAIVTGKGELINGVRLIYPMEKQAMQFVNLVGNKFFSLAFTWLLGQPIKDTLCGTKVLWQVDYQRIVQNRSYFGDFDPFGDFDLLFGAARLGLKIMDLPVRYRDRTYGSTNISRWKHGMLLIRMLLFGAKRLKFT